MVNRTNFLVNGITPSMLSMMFPHPPRWRTRYYPRLWYPPCLIFLLFPLSHRGVYMLHYIGCTGPEANLGNGKIVVRLLKLVHGYARGRGIPFKSFKPVARSERRAKQPLIMFTR